LAVQRRVKQVDKKDEKGRVKPVPTASGAGVGMVIGVGVGVAIDNIGLGIGVGMALGAGLGTIFGKLHDQKTDVKDHEEKPEE
jgi:uncharacterized membrane protein